MRKLFIVLICLPLLGLLNGCNTGGSQSSSSPQNEFNKTYFQDLQLVMKQCGYKKINSSWSTDKKLNEQLSVMFCMEDKGKKIPNLESPTDICQALAKNGGTRLPICVARGVFN